MANRNTVSIHKIEEFTEWLKQKGWTIESNKGDYDVLRARKEGRKNPLIIYKRLNTNNGGELIHYTLQDRDVNIYWNFLKEIKGALW